MKNKKYFIWLLVKASIIIALVAADLITKSYFARTFAEGESVSIIARVLSFTYTRNTGAAFSLFSQHTWWLTIISLLFVVGFFVYDFFAFSKNGWYTASFVLIMAGAVGNLYDRAVFGFVRDFIKFDFISFPIFNLADTFLTVGMICYFVFVLFFYKQQTVKK